MIRNIAALLAFSALFACGAPDEYLDAAGIDDEAELAELEQPFSAPVTPSFQFGTQTGTSRNRCNRTSSGQVCNVIDHKNIGYCSDGVGGFPTGMAGLPEYNNDIIGAFEQLDTALTTWVIDLTPFEIFQDKCLAGGSAPSGAVDTIRVFQGAVGASGTASNDTLDYVKWTYGSTTGLTEAAGVVGQYQKFFGCNITFDRTDINAKFSGSFRQKAYNHLAKQALVGCFGLGRRDFSVPVSNVTSKVMFNGTSNFSLTAGEQCALNNYDTTNNGTYANSGSSSTCPND